MEKENLEKNFEEVRNQVTSKFQPYSHYRESAWQSLTGRWNDAALTMLIAVALVLAMYIIPIIIAACGLPGLAAAFYSLGTLAAVLLAVPVLWSFSIALLNMVRGEKAAFFNATVDDFKANYMRTVPTAFVVSLITMVASALTLGIGGVYFGIAYSMVPFLMHDHKDLTLIDAMKASRNLMDGHKMDLLMLLITFIGWFILGSITCGIAYLWIQPYIYTTLAHFYEEIKAGVKIEVK